MLLLMIILILQVSGMNSQSHDMPKCTVKHDPQRVTGEQELVDMISPHCDSNLLHGAGRG